jgi:hypothetical protein
MHAYIARMYKKRCMGIGEAKERALGRIQLLVKLSDRAGGIRMYKRGGTGSVVARIFQRGGWGSAGN